MSSALKEEDPPSGGCCYRMETGQDLIDLKENRQQLFPANAWCLEASWEVANKQGGIYTVLRSKASESVREMGDRYILLGPLRPSHVHEVELYSPPPCSPLARSLTVCREKGWKVMSGRWLVEGNPIVVLVDIGSASFNIDAWKHELYEKTHIGIPNEDLECNDLVIFGFMIAQFVADFQWQTTRYLPCFPQQSCCRPPPVQPLVVAHCHEWMSGVALIMLRMWKVEVATVFTTHATLLGRHLCAGAVDFYNCLKDVKVDEEAGKRKIYHRYCIERATANLAHVFTTVSDITAEEAEYLVKRKPDIITPNGLNVKRISHEFQNLHQLHKEKILKFVHGHFHGHINFDLDKTLFLFTAGRYEFGNKGGDVFIEALARLNHYLKACGSDVTIVAFIIFPAKNSSFNVESLKGHAISKSLQETIQDLKGKLGKKLYESCSRGEVPSGDLLFSRNDQVKLKRVILASQRSSWPPITRNDQVKLKRVILASQRSSWPPITTHNVCEEAKDPVMMALKRCKLLNDPDDRVKVVFHPDFLNSDNPLLGLSYEEFVRGCHLGVFPSYYEPWGYTPAECTVMGIPSVTSNLSGFGSFVEEYVVDPSSYGIYVVDRKFKSVEETVKSLAQTMFDFSQLSRRQRIIMRNRTERLSDMLDWKKLGIYYTQARAQALAKTFPGLVTEYERMPDFKYPRAASSFSSVSRRRDQEETSSQGETLEESEVELLEEVKISEENQK